MRIYEEQANGSYIYWMDETSVNLWSTIKKKTWTDGTITLPFQGQGNFKSHTIIGAIGGNDDNDFRFVY